MKILGTVPKNYQFIENFWTVLDFLEQIKDVIKYIGGKYGKIHSFVKRN